MQNPLGARPVAPARTSSRCSGPSPACRTLLAFAVVCAAATRIEGDGVNPEIGREIAELRTVKKRIIAELTFAGLDRTSEIGRGHVERLDADVDRLLAVDGGYWSAYRLSDFSISGNGQAWADPLTLALGYATPGSKHHRSDVVLTAVSNGLRQFMKFAHPGCGQPTNWWAWQIGIPLRLIPTLLLVEKELEAELVDRELDTLVYLLKLQRHPKAVSGYVPPSPVYRGTVNTNSLWKSQGRLLFAVLTENVELAREWSRRGFGEIAPAGFGNLQADYSFKFHVDIPMWSYGNTFLHDYPMLADRFRGTSFGPSSEQLELMTLMATRYVKGFLYRGRICPAITGRTITRSDMHHYASFGPAGLAGLAGLARAGTADASKLVPIIVRELAFYPAKARDWDKLRVGMRVAPAYGDLLADPSAMLGPRLAWLTSRLDPSIDPAPPTNDIFIYPDADLMQVTRPDWAVGIKMHSDRSPGHYTIPGENQLGRFLSHGSMFHFLSGSEWDGCWPTLDWSRLPGTTVTPQARKANQSSFCGVMRSSSEVGLAAMSFQGGRFVARKSWLVNGEHIVCTGSGITGPGRVETTVCNQPVPDEAVVLIDGDPAPSAVFDREVTARWLWFGNTGYVFPGGQTLRLLRQSRTGDWRKVRVDRLAVELPPRTRQYVTAVIEHTPSCRSYSYIMLPNAAHEAMPQHAAALEAAYSIEAQNHHRVRTTDGAVDAIVLWQAARVDSVEAARGCMLLRDADVWRVADPARSESPLVVGINGVAHRVSPADGRALRLP